MSRQVPEDTDGSGDFARLLAEVADSPEVTPGPASTVHREGDLIARFQVVRELGRGGFGVVYEARDRELGRPVALKVLHPTRAAADDEVARFRAEAAAACRLNHLNVVTVHDYGVHDGCPYLVMELLRGETLAARLARAPLAVADAIDVAVALARALAHAHAHGVVHRDLKPGNVFLGDDGVVKVLDFGLAHIADAAARTAGGTPAYMAPEQRRGEGEDARVDLYSLGVVCREMLSGTGVPDVLGALIARMVERDPAHRPASATAVLDALVEAGEVARDDGAAEPFRYLEAFGERDAGWFFGRERETGRLVRLLERRTLAAVVGASGAGKSSLVQAGLVPRLRRRGVRVLTMRPGARPFERLCELAGDGVLPAPAELACRPGVLAEALRAQATVVIVDQLEELYTQVADTDARRAFADALVAVAAAGDPLRLVVTLREDYLGRVAESPSLLEAIGAHLMVVAPPDEGAMIEALERPARRAGARFEPGLVEAIVRALVGQAAPLPLLQLGASRLWQERDRGAFLVRRAALESAGGLPGLLATHADEVLAAVPPAHAQVARQVLLELVTPDRTRRQLDPRELCARLPDARLAERVLEQLVAGRLITVARGERGELAELAHESLIERWTKLRAWIDEGQEDWRLRQHVATAASDWATRGRARTLLYTGDLLAAALRWRARAAGAPSALERDFLDASEAAARRARRRQRVVLASALVSAAAVTAGALLAVRAYRLDARAARLRATVIAATSEPDPLVGALVLAEVARDGEPPGGADAARSLASHPLPLVVLRGHSDYLRSVAFSPDGTRLVTASHDGTARVWRADGAGVPIVLRGHVGWVTSATFTLDGTRVVTTSADGTARVWRADGTGAPVVLSGHERLVWAASLHPDGRHVATASEDRTVRIWDLDGQEPPSVLRGHEGSVELVAYSPDGSRLVSASDDQTARVWSGREAPMVLRGHTQAVMKARFSPDGTRIVTASTDGTARVFRVDGGAAPIVLRGHQGWIASCFFDASGARVLTAGIDGTARVWRADGTGDPLVLQARAGGAGVVTASFSPDGRQVATVTSDGYARLFALDDPVEPLALRTHAGRMGQLAFSPDGTRLATADDIDVRVWALDAARDPVVLRGHWRQVVAGLPTRDGRRVVTASNDGSVRVWDAVGARAPVVLAEGGTFVGRPALSPDGSQVAVPYVDGSVRLLALDGSGGRWLQGPSRGTDPVVAFGGDRLATVGADGIVRVFGADGLEAPIELAGPADPVAEVVVSPDGRWLATAARERARVWDLDDRSSRALGGAQAIAISPGADEIALGGADGSVRLVHPDGGGGRLLGNHAGRVVRIAFSPDGRSVLTASSDGNAAVWRLDGSTHTTLRGHDRPLFDAAFSPDGRSVVTASEDETARVWPLDRPDDPTVLRGHSFEVVYAAFLPAGDRVITCSTDRTCRIWRIGWARLVQFLAAQTRGCLPPAGRVRHLDEAPADADSRYQQCERAFGRSGL
jgi:WD40 repeat protein